jgi:RNA polymerase sigma factor (sigma-70 family)
LPSFTDSELISRVILDDDRNAFGELVRRYQSNIRNLLRKLTAGNHATADDLAQETFIRAYRHLSKFQGGASFSTWLYRIAYNVFLSSVQDKKIEESEEVLENTVEHASYQHSDQMLLKMDMEKAMIHLTEMERAAIALSYGKELPHEEIAHVMNCPLGTVKTALLRGKEKIRQRLIALNQQESI